MSILHDARSLELCQPYFEQGVNPLEYLSNYERELFFSPHVHAIANEADVQSRLTVLLHEKWSVDKDAASLLSSVMLPGDRQTPRTRPPLYFEIQMDEPILQNDPDAELADLQSRNTIALQPPQIALPELEEIRRAAWGSHGQELLDHLDEAISSAKLDVDRSAIELLQLVTPARSHAGRDLVQDALLMEEKPRLEYESPPLLPSSPQYSPSKLPEDLQQIDLASTPSNLVAREAAAMQCQLMLKDEIGDDQVSSTGMELHFDDLFDTPQIHYSSPLRRKRMRDLRTESPVTPMRTHESPAKKVKFAGLPDDLLEMVPTPEPQTLSDGELEAVTKAMEVLAEPVLSRLQNEQLLELDTVMRINVPSVDDIRPLAPWEYNGDEQDFRAKGAYHLLLLSRLRRELLNDVSEWKGISKASRALQWKPIMAGYGSVNLEEAFEDVPAQTFTDCAVFEAEPDVHALIARPPGLLLLTMEDDLAEDDIDVPDCKSPSPSTMPGRVEEQVTASGDVRSLTNETGDNRLRMLIQKRAAEINVNHLDTRLSGMDSTMANLDLFLQLQGGARPEREPPPEPPASAAQEDCGAAQIHHEADETQRHQAQAQAQAQAQVASVELEISDREVQVIVSRSILAAPNLLRHLQSLLPSLDIMERDELTDDNNPGTDQRQNMNLEADMTLSPSTGLIITSLQRLNQVRLPGQTCYFGIRERIVAASRRYEHLIVLVGNRQATSLDQRACESYCDFLGFSAGLDANVQVEYYVGGEDELARWIAAAITHHSHVLDGVRLLQDETLWERFLRQAGMNAFAAQVVLAKLKAPSVSERDHNAAFGLAAFVMDSPTERLAKLQLLLGGSKVLERIGDAVDEGWSAVAGPRGSSKSYRRV